MNLTTQAFSCLSETHISYLLPYKSCHERNFGRKETRTGEEKDSSAAALRLGRARCWRERGWSAGWSDPLPHFSRLGGGDRVPSRRSAGLGHTVARRAPSVGRAGGALGGSGVRSVAPPAGSCAARLCSLICAGSRRPPR